jgi:hypothetical protein
VASVRRWKIRDGIALVLSASGIGLSGCLSGAMQLGAAPTPPGTTEWGVAVNGLLYERGRQYALLPSPELSWRRGRDEDSDFGVRAYLLGLEAGTRHRVLATQRLTLGAMPSVELAYTPVTNNTTEILHARLHGTLVADWRLASRWCVSLGGRLTLEGAGPLTVLRGLPDGASLILQPAAAAGAAFELTPKTRLRLDASMGMPVDLADGPRRLVGQAGLAVQWSSE